MFIIYIINILIHFVACFVMFCKFFKKMSMLNMCKYKNIDRKFFYHGFKSLPPKLQFFWQPSEMPNKILPRGTRNFFSFLFNFCPICCSSSPPLQVFPMASTSLSLSITIFFLPLQPHKLPLFQKYQKFIFQQLMKFLELERVLWMTMKIRVSQ